MPPDLVAIVDELMLGSMKAAAHLLGIVIETPKPRTFAAFLERLEATDPVELKLHLFGYYGSSSSHLAGSDVIERAARGDADAQEVLLQSVVEYSDKHEMIRSLLELGADEVKAQPARAPPALVRRRSSSRMPRSGARRPSATPSRSVRSRRSTRPSSSSS